MKRTRITMQMIADKLGVTKVTVSKALNGQPGVSQELRGKIVKVSEELGYQVRHARVPLEALGAKSFGFVVAKRFFVETDRFYTSIFYHMSRRCDEMGDSIHLRIADPADEQNPSPPFQDARDALDGIFIVGEMNAEYIKAVMDAHVPCVTVDFCRPNLPVDCVVTDNFYASYAATTHLVDRGHRNIGFVGNPEYSSSVADRYYGYQKALREAQLPYRQDWHLTTNDGLGIYFSDVNLPSELPTAFVCHCDMAAYHLMLILRQHGILVPQQVSLISFDNTVLSSNTTPPLTTVNIDTAVMAEQAYRLMKWRLGAVDHAPRRVILSPDIIVRDSVCPVTASPAAVASDSFRD